MELNEKQRPEIHPEQTMNKDYILEMNNKENQLNTIINNNNLNQSIGSIKTTEYSSESGELISKYKTCNYKNSQNFYNPKKDNYKDNINENININNLKEENNKNKKNKNNNKKNKKAPKFEEYKCEYLSKNNINTNASKIPLEYNREFNLDNNTNQTEIGDQDFIKNINVVKSNINKDYKKISKIPHDKLSHLYINDFLYVNKQKYKYNKLSVTQRIKHKFLTFIYLSPKQ